MAYGKSVGSGEVQIKAGRVALTDVNAGTIVIPARAGKSIMIVGGQMVAIGGNAAANTSVNLNDTAGSPIVGVACLRAGLTQNAQLDFDAAAQVTRTTYRAPLTAGKAVKPVNVGTAMTTATHVDYYVEYVYVDA